MSETLTAQDQLLFEQLAASQLVGEQPDAGSGLGLGLQALLRRQSSRYDESVHGRRVVEMTEAQRIALADFLQAADEEAEPPQVPATSHHCAPASMRTYRTSPPTRPHVPHPTQIRPCSTHTNTHTHRHTRTHLLPSPTLRPAPPAQRLSFDARLLISELEICVHVSDFFPETVERNRTLAATPPPPPPGRLPKPARVTLVASVHNVGLNVGGRPDGYLVDFFWETVPPHQLVTPRNYPSCELTLLLTTPPAVLTHAPIGHGACAMQVQVSLERQGGGVPATSVPLVAPAPRDAPPVPPGCVPPPPGAPPPPLARTASRAAMPMEVDTSTAFAAAGLQAERPERTHYGDTYYGDTH